MVAPRPALARGLVTNRLARSVPSSVVRRNLRPAFRRCYASGADAHASSSDIPWLIGAIVVTVPSCYYLWPEKSHGGAHHGHGVHESHDESDPVEADQADDASKESEDGAQEGTKDQAADQQKKTQENDGSEDHSGSKQSGSASTEPDTVETEKPSNKKVEGVQFKGKTSAGDENNEMPDTRKREPDSKGGLKKRIDSAYQKDLGAGENYDEEGNPTGKTATKPTGIPGAIDTKQHGLSTTPTRHSTQIDQDPEKSKKGEGVPETAKSTTAVDPKRTQGSGPK